MALKVTRIDILKALAEAVDEVSKGCDHPEDVMASAFTTTEAIYKFLDALPMGVWANK